VQGKISSLLLESDAKGLIAVLKSPYDLTTGEQKEILSAARAHFENVSLMVGGEEVGGFGRQILELPLNESGTLLLQVPAGSFSQVNWSTNLRLLNASIEQAGIAAGSTVYDLFAGAGNFALPFARSGMKVVAVECDKRLVNLGRENAKRYGLDNKLQYVDSSVERFLSRLPKTDKADLVIADPPRSGLGQMIHSMNFASRLQLISCHLPSFVRDIKGLLENGWQVERIQPFDMFPQTSHVEILGVLSRS
ncbi:MAG: class I SAM-dependent RNA methyltransferase, partial [Planctomycetales bacterium]|nr:class I SAM-dependent RNA methyltransferase [Planctomycetales bacterium]